MLLSEQKDFYRALDGLFSTHDREPKKAVFEIWWKTLEPFQLKDVLSAMSEIIKTSSYLPKPADLFRILHTSITASEAWAWIPKSESDGGYVNQRMLYAYGQAVSFIATNHLGAPNQFKDAYDSPTGRGKDEVFYYSEGQGVPYEEKEAQKVSDLRRLESTGWVKGKELLYLAPPSYRDELERKLIASGVLALEGVK